MASFWTCQRQAAGVKCATRNPARLRKCGACGKPRPARRQPAHMAVLSEMTYEQAVELYGERCGVCGAGPGTRRLHRDHEHKGSGIIRGLLCFRCNAALRSYMTVEWLEKVAAYLRRANGDTAREEALERLAQCRRLQPSVMQVIVSAEIVDALVGHRLEDAA